MKILYIGSLAQSGNSLALCEALQSLHIEVKAVDPSTLTSTESKIQRVLFRTVNNGLNLIDTQPTNDPIMEGRGIQRLRRDREMSAQGLARINQAIREIADSFKPDMTLLFHSHYIQAETLDACHHYGPNFCFYPDDAFTPELYSLSAMKAIKRFDCVMTTKSFNVPEFYALGVPVVIFVNNSYHPQCHHPVELTDEDRQYYGRDVAFVGNAYSTQRADFLAALVEACPGISFGIWGHWSKLKNPLRWYKARRGTLWPRLHQHTHGPVFCEEMSKVIGASKINLGLLKPSDGPTRIRDYQTTRSVEIPASGGFMLAEYTDEHNSLFREGYEAAYFRSFDDLVSKIHYYLQHDEERRQIAQAGLDRCLNSDYTFLNRATTILEEYRKWCVNYGRLDKAQRVTIPSV
jgi:spore maturation protein CgeB